MEDLIKRYDVPGPRYTSYPTVPFWKNEPLEADQWMASMEKNKDFFSSNEISLYVHLPFCESLCTFCGCHKRITKNHSVEQPYIDTLLEEWFLYQQKLSYSPLIKELHLGGGTPTFFKPSELTRLVKGLFRSEKVDPKEVELSCEAHPKNTTDKHLMELYDFGFRRLSLGVQDYNPEVQKAINRIQPFEQVEKVHTKARLIGYSSISHDLVFGLPKQQLSDMLYTVERTLELMPDRISLYSYAHIPWVKGNGQRGYDESDLPKSEVKRELYERSKELLLNAGYIEVGMDHFALPNDDLAIAFKARKLHRNFMGYTTKSTNTMIGLGMSAISDSWFGFAQNDKSVEGYTERIKRGELPIFRGHVLSALDVEIRTYILDLMCHFETKFNENSGFKNIHETIKDGLTQMVSDGLVKLDGNTVRITSDGVPFVRNCCMVFDQNLKPETPTERMFSRTI